MGLMDLGASALDVAGKLGGMGLQDHFNRRSSDRAFWQSMHASSTQYQRAVADLKAAGLNPVLAAGGGMGSAPSASSLGVAGQNIDLVGSGLATGSAQSTRDLQKEQSGAAKAAASASMAGAALAQQQAETAASQIPVNSANAAKLAADAGVAAEQQRKLRMANEAYEKLKPAERLLYDTGQLGGVGAVASGLIGGVVDSGWNGLKQGFKWIKDKFTPSNETFIPYRAPKRVRSGRGNR